MLVGNQRQDGCDKNVINNNDQFICLEFFTYQSVALLKNGCFSIALTIKCRGVF